jgi:murein DD-endopeptidase MepM/ murein hydrolase activator NlpD
MTPDECRISVDRLDREGGRQRPFVRSNRRRPTAPSNVAYRVNVAAPDRRYAQLVAAKQDPLVQRSIRPPFGMRMDPLLPVAIHTGIDLYGDTGEPVRATATGA